MVKVLAAPAVAATSSSGPGLNGCRGVGGQGGLEFLVLLVQDHRIIYTVGFIRLMEARIKT